MPLPDFNGFGDLPEGIHVASFAELTTRFGAGTIQRRAVTIVCIVFSHWRWRLAI
jgi:hypothetical protein